MNTSTVRQHPVHIIVRHPSFRQFIKFCIVGASSTLLNLFIFGVAVYHFHLKDVVHQWLAGSPNWQVLADRYQVYAQVANFFGFIFGVTNGYIWNSRWTFQDSNPAQRHAQFVKFVLVNVVGLILQQIILFVSMNVLLANASHLRLGIRDLRPFIGEFIAISIVVFWNFFANKHWTFKK